MRNDVEETEFEAGGKEVWEEKVKRTKISTNTPGEWATSTTQAQALSNIRVRETHIGSVQLTADAIANPRLQDGIRYVSIPTWSAFTSYVTRHFLDATNYIYRGHADASWLLESSLDRVLKRLGLPDNSAARDVHLERFRYATRGRRGPNPAKLDGENDWWALGQHNGLETPLLDWTSSPYVAAFFAFAGAPRENVSYRAVFALSRAATSRKNRELTAEIGVAAPTIELVRPMSDENPRLVSQGGLFTRTPDNVDVETWVRSNFPGHTKAVIDRMELPETERLSFLRNLNRMNINHLTLFPDLYGAGKYCQFALEIDKY